MQLNDLRPNEGSRPKHVRKGRGIGSTLGKTSGRGQKGQKARSGGGVRLGFEGGQFRKEFVPVALADLERFENGTVVTEELLLQSGVVKNKRDGLKVLANGELTKQLTVALPCSKAASEKIVAAGGKVEIIC